MPTLRMEVITPEKAKEYLDSHPHENTSQKIVDFHKKDMEGVTGISAPASLVFDKDGNIIEGLHRLVAISQLGHPARVPVITDADGYRKPHLFSY